jgi:hypothetical protein
MSIRDGVKKSLRGKIRQLSKRLETSTIVLTDRRWVLETSTMHIRDDEVAVYVC